MTFNKDLSQDGHPALVSLRVVAVVSSVAAVISLGWATKALQGVYTDVTGWALCAIVLGPVGFALVWSTIVLTVRLAFRRSIHPGLYVAMDFLAFGSVVGATSALIAVMEPYLELGYTYSCAPKPCSTAGIGHVTRFGVTMAMLNGVVHLILFVWACWACHGYRKRSKKVEV